MLWVDYGGQDVSTFDYIGTDSLQYPLEEGSDVEQTIEELRRRCGRLARIKLFRKEDVTDAGDR